MSGQWIFINQHIPMEQSLSHLQIPLVRSKVRPTLSEVEAGHLSPEDAEVHRVDRHPQAAAQIRLDFVWQRVNNPAL